MNPIIRVVDDDVFLESVVLVDAVAARLLEEKEGSARVQLLADMLEVGARVLQHQQDGESGAIVRRELDILRTSMESILERAYGESGSGFVEAMRPVLEQVAQQISVLSRRFDGVLAVQEKQREVEQERDRGTAKGRPFEDDIAEHVGEIARHQGDTCEHVGDAWGISGRAGDVLVEIGASEGPGLGKIIFEAKTGQLSRPEALRELDRAMEQRGADYAVLVVAGNEKVPANLFELREYGGNKMVVVYDEWSSRGVDLAYSLARARILASKVETEGADVAAAKMAIEQVVQQLDEFRPIKMRLTSIVTATEETRALIEAMSAHLRSKLVDVSLALSSSA